MAKIGICRIGITLGSLLLAFIMYTVVVKLNKGLDKTKKLCQLAKQECIDTTMDDIVNGHNIINGNCYSFIADFEIRKLNCANNILKESICDRSIFLNQKVEQYQKYTGCKKGRNSFTSLGRKQDTTSLPDLEKMWYGDIHPTNVMTGEEIKEHKDLKARKGCVKEDQYGFFPIDNPKDSLEWYFPSRDNLDRGERQFVIGDDPEGIDFNPDYLRFQNPDSSNKEDSISFGIDYDMAENLQPIYMNRNKIVKSLRLASRRTGYNGVTIWNDTSFYGDQNLDTERDMNNLCFDKDESYEWSNKIDGYSNQEFRNLSSYGDINKFPLCSATYPNQKLGNYKVSAYGSGENKKNQRIVGRIVEKQINGNVTYHLIPYTNAIFEDEIFKPNDKNRDPMKDTFDIFMLGWSDGSKSTEEAIDEMFEELAEHLKGLTGFFKFFMWVFFLIAVGINFCANIKSSSSSS